MYHCRDVYMHPKSKIHIQKELKSKKRGYSKSRQAPRSFPKINRGIMNRKDNNKKQSQKLAQNGAMHGYVFPKASRQKKNLHQFPPFPSASERLELRGQRRASSRAPFTLAVEVLECDERGLDARDLGRRRVVCWERDGDAGVVHCVACGYVLGQRLFINK